MTSFICQSLLSVKRTSRNTLFYLHAYHHWKTNLAPGRRDAKNNAQSALKPRAFLFTINHRATPYTS